MRILFDQGTPAPLRLLLRDHEVSSASRSIAIVVLGTTSWPRIKVAVEFVIAAVNAATPGTYSEVAIP